MSILNVNQIQPVGSGQTVTISATNISAGSATVTAGTFTGNLTGNVTGNATGLSGSPTLSGITSVSTTNLTVNGNAYPNVGPLSNRNLIINGAMQVAQRGTSFSPAATSSYTLDRWGFGDTTDAVFDVVQSSTAPAGFSNSLRIDCTTSSTPTAAQESYLDHRIEAQNLQHLQYGTSGAQSVTLSFWVRSNKTGNYGLWVYQEDAASQYATTYTISSADTWEYKTITIPGNTATAINNDNGQGLLFRFYLQAGPTYAGTPAETWTTSLNSNRTTSMNLGDSTSNEWYLTGVQLEVGTVATPFEHRSYGDELARCQRYYLRYTADSSDCYGFSGCALGTGIADFDVTFPCSMRATPTFNFNGAHRMIAASDSASFTSGLVIARQNTDSKSTQLEVTGTSGMVSGQAGSLQAMANGAYLEFISEI